MPEIVCPWDEGTIGAIAFKVGFRMGIKVFAEDYLKLVKAAAKKRETERNEAR